MGRSKNNSAFSVALGCIAWIGNAAYACGPAGGVLKHYSPGLVALALSLFFLIHCNRRYGGVHTLAFLIIVFVIGWAFETLSVKTGVPFGHYHYAQSMAPFLGHVPVFVLPAYLFMGYAAWSMATLLLGNQTVMLLRENYYRVPLLAAFFMTLWDFNMDPLRATVEGRWYWVEGGAFLGVPLSNFVGWFFVTWCMFQLFALFLIKFPYPKQLDCSKDTHYWAAIPVAYSCFAGEYLINPLTGHGTMTIAVVAVDVSVQNIYTIVAILTLFTLVPALILGLIFACGWRLYTANATEQ